MKFQKFVKSIGSEGVVYKRKNGELWLASENVFMKIPEDIRSITCEDIADMPEFIDDIIKYDSFTEPCELRKAIMPYADGGIKDCVRIYATSGNVFKMAIDNTSYSLIERRDIVEMFVHSSEDEEKSGKALVVKRYDTGDDEEVIGLIFRTDYEL